MKSSTRKTMLAGVFACAFATVTLGALSFNAASADVTITQDTDKIAMVQGASLRLEHTVEVDGENKDVPFGLRFKTDVNKSWLDGLNDETAQVYTLLVPTNYMDEELTEDDAKGENAKAVKVTLDMGKAYEVGDNYRFNTVLAKIPDTQYGREITARSFIVAGGETYYSDTVARSVVGVASEALVYDSTEYADVAQYLVKDVSATAEIQIDSTGTLSLSYADGIKDEARAILQDNLTVTVKDGEGNVTYENGTLTAVQAGETMFTVSTLGFSKDVTVKAHKGTFGTPILETVTAENVTAYSENTTDFKVYKNDETNKNEIEFTVKTVKNTTLAGTDFGVLIDCPAWVQEFKNTAYLNVTFELVNNIKTATGATNTDWGWYVIDSELYNGATPNSTKYIEPSTVSIPVNLSRMLTGEGKIALTVKNAANQNYTATFRVTDIEFCLGKVLYSNGGANLIIPEKDADKYTNNGVNLLNRLGLKESEIVSATFGGEAVTDFTEFRPTQSGELEFMIKKAGYINEYQTAVEVVVIQALTYTAGSAEGINFNTITDLFHNNYNLSYTVDNGNTWVSVTDKDLKRNQQPTEDRTYRVYVPTNVTATQGIEPGTLLFIDVDFVEAQ